MTVEVQASSVAYTGNGVQTAFPTTFSFGADSDLTVKVTTLAGVTTTKALNVDYTVTGAAAAEPGGNVNFLAPPTNGYVVTIERNTPITQLTNFQTSGPYSAATLTRQFDKETRELQELKRRVAALEAAAPNAVITGTGQVTDTFIVLDPPESTWPRNVACSGTPKAVMLGRVENLTDGSEKQYNLGAPAWGSPILSQFTVNYIPGLTVGSQYRVTFEVFT